MATHDHTVRIRSSVPPVTAPSPPLDAPSSAAPAWPEHSMRGDIALAVLALSRLRLDSEQCRQAQARGFPGKALSWPLSASVTASLGTAIHCLQQYARLLADEPRVNTARPR